MKCYFCNQDTLESKKIIYKTTVENKTYIIKNVPVEHCTSCIEDFFDMKVTDNIEKIIDIAKAYKTNDDIIIVDYYEMINTLDEISAAI